MWDIKLRKENLEKFAFFNETLKSIFRAKDCIEALTNATNQIISKYNDPLLAKGIQEITIFFKKINYDFSVDFRIIEGGAIKEFSTQYSSMEVDFPVMIPGLYELLAAYVDLKPGEHRYSVALTTEKTLDDFMLDLNAEDDVIPIFKKKLSLYVYGRTKAGEVYVIKIDDKRRKFHEKLKKEIREAMQEELQELRKLSPKVEEVFKI